MATQYTSRLTLPYPEAADTADVPRDVQALAEQLDSTIATDDQGAIASRPTSTAGSPGIRGRYYFATDEGILYRDRGTQWDAVAAVGADTSSPTGHIIQYVGVSAPTGWLLCDGTRYTNTSYAALAAVIGSRFTIDGDPAGTFRVPDMRGRATIGAGTGTDLTARTLGANGGAETHTLTSGQLPSHTHSGTTATEGAHTHTGSTNNESSHTHGGTTAAEGSHNHSGSTTTDGNHQHQYTSTGGYTASTTQIGGAQQRVYQLNYDGSTYTTAAGSHAHTFTTGAGSNHSHSYTSTSNSGHSHTVTTGAGTAHAHTFTSDGGTGAGQAHANMQPWIALNHLIRI